MGRVYIVCMLFCLAETYITRFFYRLVCIENKSSLQSSLGFKEKEMTRWWFLFRFFVCKHDTFKTIE